MDWWQVLTFLKLQEGRQGGLAPSLSLPSPEATIYERILRSFAVFF